MQTRSAINTLPAQLCSDMPAMLRNRNMFSREFDDRACQILAVTAPQDEAYADEAITAYVVRNKN